MWREVIFVLQVFMTNDERDGSSANRGIESPGEDVLITLTNDRGLFKRLGRDLKCSRLLLFLSRLHSAQCQEKWVCKCGVVKMGSWRRELPLQRVQRAGCLGLESRKTGTTTITIAGIR